jgi:hypothetical protein
MLRSITVSFDAASSAYACVESALPEAAPGSDVSAVPKLKSTNGSTYTGRRRSTRRTASVMRSWNGTSSCCSRSGQPVTQLCQFVPGQGSFIAS